MARVRYVARSYEVFDGVCILGMIYPEYRDTYASPAARVLSWYARTFDQKWETRERTRADAVAWLRKRQEEYEKEHI